MKTTLGQVFCAPLANSTSPKLWVMMPPKKQPIQFNWPDILHQTRSTCTRINKCPICEEATRFGRRSLVKLEISHAKPGRPMINSPVKVVKHCSKCLSEISQGLSQWFPHFFLSFPLFQHHFLAFPLPKFVQLILKFGY